MASRCSSAGQLAAHVHPLVPYSWVPGSGPSVDTRRRNPPLPSFRPPPPTTPNFSLPGGVPRALGGKTDEGGPGDKTAPLCPSRHGFHMLGRPGHAVGGVSTCAVEPHPVAQLTRNRVESGGAWRPGINSSSSVAYMSPFLHYRNLWTPRLKSCASSDGWCLLIEFLALPVWMLVAKSA